ncbi:MAG: TolC family protein [Ignavibacteria bacterium]|nr:TolC family protein [Ignavibacteria bacterium]
MKKIFLILLILQSGIYSAKAQETINLKQAVEAAIQNNTVVSNLKKSLEVQQLNTKGYKGNLLPNLSMNASMSRNNTYSGGTVTFQNGVPTIIPEQDSWINNFRVGLSSSVVLFNGFSNYEQIDLGKENETSVRININKQIIDISYNVTAAYFDLLKKEKIVKANQDNLADSQLQLDRIKEYMNVGKKTISDVYKQDVQVAQNELILQRSINEFDKSKVDLLYVMNTNMNRDILPSDDNLKTELSEDELKNVLNKNSNTEVLLSQALENRYDYKSYEQTIKINEVQLSIDKKNLFYPTISAFANYNVNASRVNDILDSRTFSFGLNLTYSLFSGFSLMNKMQTSEITIKQNQDNLSQLQQQIRSELKKSYLDLQTAYKQIEISNRNLVSAEQDKLLSEENYRVGLGTLLDVQTASTKLNALKIERINAYYDFMLAKKKLEYYTGDLTY